MSLRRPRSMLWEDLRRPEFEALVSEETVVILPIASLEQHGPHLPVGTDISIARAVAIRAAELVVEGPVIVMPVIWSGVTPFHMPFQGTVTLQIETFIRLVTDLCLSLQRQGFHRIVLLNSHGGNIGALETTVLGLVDSGLRVAAATYYLLTPEETRRLCESDQGMFGHAAYGETSMQLYLQPENVDRAAMTPQNKGTAAVWGIPPELLRGIYMTGNFKKYAPSGVAGDHTNATEGAGQSLIEVAGAALARFIRAYRELPLEQ